MKIESEKVLERKLRKKVKSLGGLCLKFVPFHFIGFPDRICLFPNGKVAFVEVKTTNENPDKIQMVRIRELKKLGFHAEVIDNSEDLENFINEYS